MSARERAESMVAGLRPDLSLRKGASTISVVGTPRAIDGAVEIVVRVMRGALDVTPADLNPVRIVNPPVLVPDPAGDVERTVTSRDGTVTRKFREDPSAALLAVLGDLVP